MILILEGTWNRDEVRFSPGLGWKGGDVSVKLERELESERRGGGGGVGRL